MPKSSPVTPKRHTWLISISAICAVYQILFAYRVLIDNRISPDQLSLVPVVQAGLAMFWGCLFSYVTWRMWVRHYGALRLLAWLLICFLCSQLVQTILFVQADYNRNRISFLVALTLMILIVPVGYLLQQSRQRTPK